jgi:hypothetical protein
VDKHVHEWRYAYGNIREFDDRGPIEMTEWWFECKCGEHLGDAHGPIDEIERRLNAVERLSAEDARNAQAACWNDDFASYSDEAKALGDYVSALEGEDE